MRLSLLPEGTAMNPTLSFVPARRHAGPGHGPRCCRMSANTAPPTWRPGTFDPRKTLRTAQREALYMRESLEGPLAHDGGCRSFVGSACGSRTTATRPACFVVGGRGTGKSTCFWTCCSIWWARSTAPTSTCRIWRISSCGPAWQTLTAEHLDEADVARAFTTKYFNSITSGKRVDSGTCIKQGPLSSGRPASWCFASNRFPYTLITTTRAL